MAAAAAAQGTARVDDFSCGICYELCVEPVVGNCGHDFCRHCLTRWTTQQRRTSIRSVTCPVCRGVFASTAVQDLNVCIRLRDTIQLLFPAQLESRKAEMQQEAAEVASAAAALEAADTGIAGAQLPTSFDDVLALGFRELGMPLSTMNTLDSLVTLTQSLLGALGGRVSQTTAARPAGVPGLAQAAAAAAAASPPAFPGFPSPALAPPLSPSAGQRAGFNARMPAAVAPAAAAAAGAASSGGLRWEALNDPPSLQLQAQQRGAPGQGAGSAQQRNSFPQLRSQQEALQWAMRDMPLDQMQQLLGVQQGALEQTAPLTMLQQGQPQRVMAAQVGNLVFLRPGSVSPTQPSPAAAGIGTSNVWGGQLNPLRMPAGTVPAPFSVSTQANRAPTSNMLAFSAAAPQHQMPMLPAQPMFTMGWYHPRPRATPASRRERRRRTNLRFQRPGRRQPAR